ncbi:MAG: MAPEG family protein [Idiomarina sp.]|nr:MAPEG family protein [Idiomarina sp.]
MNDLTLHLSQYAGSLLWLGILLTLVMVQWLIAGWAKARLPGAIPGLAPAPELGHSSFAFRAWRTHQNTVENLGTMLGATVFCMFVGASPIWTQVLLVIMVIGRVAHMGLYYGIATEKNPSPRSYFFMISWFANCGLLVLGFISLFN